MGRQRGDCADQVGLERRTFHQTAESPQTTPAPAPVLASFDQGTEVPQPAAYQPWRRRLIASCRASRISAAVTVSCRSIRVAKISNASAATSRIVALDFAF